MSGCYDCLNTGAVLVCDECGTPSAEPRITPAMVRRLHAALDRAHRRNGGCDCMTTMREIDAWAARENKRSAK